MSKYFKKVAKDASSLTGKAVKDAGSLTGKVVKAAIAPLVTEVVSEIIKETGVVEELKGQLVDLGIKAVKESGIDPIKLGHKGIKSLIMNDIDSFIGTKPKK